jgi:hypothetical protein
MPSCLCDVSVTVKLSNNDNNDDDVDEFATKKEHTLSFFTF